MTVWDEFDGAEEQAGDVDVEGLAADWALRLGTLHECQSGD